MTVPSGTTADETRILGLSEFLSGWVSRHPRQWADLRAEGVLDDEDVTVIAPPPDPEQPDFIEALRRYRNERLAIIAWRDLAGIDTLETVLACLTRLAEQCIAVALEEAEQAVAERHGALTDDNGQPIRLIVIAMGKLGGGELNFSSDVDLIFGHAGHGQSDGRRSLDASAWLTRVARRLIRLLNEVTAHGFVYRVDTRLRPFGGSGAMVMSLAALENYYQVHGREWERYAWIKARPVAGDMAGGQRLIEILRPFVFRRYLDYGTFESIRDMKSLLDRQVERADLQDNIKLGSGGIREIEFIVQAFQLIRGGQEPELQHHQLLPTLGRLAAAGHLSVDTAATLESAYRFLRRTENRLQMWADQQTHDLPVSTGRRQALAAAMHHEDWPAFVAALAEVRQRVHKAFARVFESPLSGATEYSAAEKRLQVFWEGGLSDEDSRRLLAGYGIADIGAVRSAVQGLQGRGRYRALQRRGQRWLMRLVPLLFEAAARTDAPDQALVRSLSVLASVIGRSTYVALLVEYPDGLASLMRLCAVSPWITGQIRQHPALLDSLLDPTHLYKPPRRGAQEAALEHELSVLPEADLERKMDVLRRFTQREMLRIAAADVSNAMPLMIVSDRLTDLAEVVVAAALDMAWRQMAEHYGVPRKNDGEREDFGIIGYGKLGGLEMGYGSDLDLVFVYDGPRDAMTDGRRPLTHHAFFTRLAQRLIHVLSIRTPAGRAYEVDLRLRPSGGAGLLAIPLAAFEAYQGERAWTWEHQALVRARFITGSLALSRRFKQVREDILARPRDAVGLAGAVHDMRERMRRSLDQSHDEWLDVKQMPGGLIDIEFMAQYAALRHGHDCRELLLFSDTIRILETLESAQLVDYYSTRMLTSAYRAWRRHIHKQALQEQPPLIGAAEQTDKRAAVERLWHLWIARPAATVEAQPASEQPPGHRIPPAGH